VNPADAQFWTIIDRLVAVCAVVIDRPTGSAHPRFPDMIYPLDYGYLEGTLASDGGGIDVWLGSSGARDVTGVIVTVSLSSRESENKILLGCSEAEASTIVQFMSDDMIGFHLFWRP
jgi:inorganic pyrophosphatase